MFIKTLLTALIALLSAFFSFVLAQSSLLYQVSGNDLAQPSYLFGTIHLMCPDDIRISETLKEKLTNSEQLVLELDMDEPNIMQTMQQKMMLPEGKTIRDMMSEADYQLLSQFFQDSLKMPIQAVERFSPIALYSVLAMQMLPCQPGSYEASLMQLAQENEQEVIGLETIDEQMAAFNRISEEEQVNYLTEVIEEYDESRREFEQLIEAYQSQNADELYQLSQESMEDAEGMIQHLLVDRNEAWVPKMAEMMQEQPTFFAVGAGHLGGEQGVLKLLEEAGYTVEMIVE